MINLTQSSPELEAKLGTLIELVHCRQHTQSFHKVTRINTWTAKFPTGDGFLQVENQIKRVLGGVPSACIATSRKRNPCKRGIGEKKAKNCTKVIEKIVKPEFYSDDACLDKLLRALEMNMYCHAHIDKEPPKEVASWKSRIVEIREKADSKLVQSTQSNTSEDLQSQTRAPNNQETGSLETQDGNTPSCKIESYQYRETHHRCL
jgi:hypothetical protein